ncbi:MAG: MarR family transcriptional regulator [Alphaproteobacteria bacterium]|nr:MarR family transcriptional regulator [Alphaproteobacteria bacterium]
MEKNLGYMLSDIARLVRRRFDERSRDLGVTSSQWRVLIYVNRSPGINQGALAELLEVEPITTCRMVDRLEQAGLIERRRDPNDRRAWRLFLTTAAMPLLDGLKTCGAHLTEMALAGLTKSDQENLYYMLGIVRHNLIGAATERNEAQQHG